VRPDLVSIIVPFHDTARYLEDAVKSILHQTYRPIEVLLVEDGTPGEMAEVARRLVAAHDELRLLHLPDNRGAAAARNRGLDDATGAFLTFLDADDCMLPDRVAVQVAYLTDRPEVDVVMAAEELIVEPDAPPWARRQNEIADAGPRFHTMSVMVRRAAFVRVGPFDPGYRVGEDLDWLFRASVAGLLIKKLDRVLTRHRLHGNNLSYRTSETRRAIIRSLRRQLTDRRENGHVPGHGHHSVL
jgi:glycosyltransferase involved in cell wall biosynthesis